MARKTEQRTPPGNADDLLQQAKQTTSEVVEQVQQQAGSKMDRRKDEAAGELDKVAQAVRQFGERFSHDEGPIAHYVAEGGKRAADGLERFTSYIRQKDVKSLARDLGNLGRRQPALLIGGAFVLGLAGARLLKSAMPANGSDTRLDRGLPPPSQQPVHVQTTSAAL
jgi:hypothetical protein